MKQRTSERIRKKLLFSIAAILFLSSCSDKLSLMKRRYSKGYYVAVTKHNSLSNNAKATKTSQSHIQKKEYAQAHESQPHYNHQGIENVPLLQVPTVKTTSIKTKKENCFLLASAIGKKSSTRSVNHKLVSETKSFYPEAGRDHCLKGVLLSILTFIVPPLAIYLRDFEFDVWFWISLSLWVLSLIFVLLPYSEALYTLATLFLITSWLIALIYVAPDCLMNFFDFFMF